jgi:hypothetical protein
VQYPFASKVQFLTVSRVLQALSFIIAESAAKNETREETGQTGKK